MEDILGMLLGICALIGLPWLILHYVTKWKQAPKITDEDEKLLDEMYNLARRLEARVETVERIVAADNPDFRPGLNAPEYRPALDNVRERDLRDYRIEGRN